MRFLIRFFRRWFRPRPTARPPAHLALGVSAWTPHSAEPAVILPEVIRCQHPGIIGLSGVGKSHFVERLIRQDVAHGTGFVLFDVHGDLAERVIRYPADRSSADPEIHRRTVIIEPFDSARVFGFNPLLYRAVV